MECSKTYYGGTSFDKEELAETKINHRIELEYYKTKEEHNKQMIYGIEVVKKEYREKGIDIEANNVANLSDCTNKVEEIIDTLKRYKVTPVCLHDVIEDIIYQKINAETPAEANKTCY